MALLPQLRLRSRCHRSHSGGRPLDHDPGFASGGRAHADDLRYPRDHRDVLVPAQRARVLGAEHRRAGIRSSARSPSCICLRYSLDNISLMALTVLTGFVVDDAIVVLENVSRHIEAGMSRVQAAIKGAGEVCFTVMSMSISLIAVFIPILLMGGIVGRLFREFAITLSVSIMVSLAVSLATTPMMCALLLKRQEHGRESRFQRVQRRHLRCDAAGLRSHIALGARPPTHRRADFICDDRSQRSSLL